MPRSTMEVKCPRCGELRMASTRNSAGAALRKCPSCRARANYKGQFDFKPMTKSIATRQAGSLASRRGVPVTLPKLPWSPPR